MSEKRVLHLITRFVDGGAERTTVNTIETLQEADTPYDLRLGFGAAADDDRVADVESLGVETVQFDLIRHYDLVAAVGAVGSVARYLRSERIDILHTHSTEAGVIGRLAARIAGTPHIVHEIHGDPITTDRHPLLNAFVLGAERLTAPVADVLVAKSKLIRDTYLDRGIGRPGQYVLVHHGVELDRFRDGGERRRVEVSGADVPETSGTAPEPDGGRRQPTLLYVGRLEEGKGLFDLLDAFERLEGGARLRIAGEGSLRADVESAVQERGLGASVDVLGYREDVPDLMADADIFVLPSYREGTPRVITEALASGLPVVSTDIAGIPEQVAHGETGLLVEPGDVEALAGALDRLARSPRLRREMGRQAVDSVESFGLERAQRQFVELYRSLLTDGPVDA